MTGFVIPSLSLGLGAVLLQPNTRGILPVGGQILIPQATIEEVHHDELVITENPVEFGSNISDHAYKLPAEVVVRFGYSNSPSSQSGGIIGAATTIGSTLNQIPGIGAINSGLQTIQSITNGNSINQVKDVYQNLLSIQTSLIPFSVYTGKRVYANMLLKSLTINTDKNSENSLMVTATFRQIIFAVTQTISTPINNNAQAIPQSTTKTLQDGSKNLISAPGYKP